MTTFEAIEDPEGEFFVKGPEGLKFYCATKKEAEECAFFLNQEEKNEAWLEEMQLLLDQHLLITKADQEWLERWLDKLKDEYTRLFCSTRPAG